MRAVASAVATLPAEGEIIVVDDGSRVPARNVLEESGRVIVIDNPGPRGPSVARNAGVKRARHPVVLFLDDDDELLPDYCSRILDAVDEHPDVSFGSSVRLQRKLSGRLSARKSPPYQRMTGLLDSTAPLQSKLQVTSGLWIRREIFLALDGFDDELFISEDAELCIRLVAAGCIMWNDPKPGVIRNVIKPHARLQDRASLGRSTSPKGRVRCYHRILEKHGHYLAEQSPSLRRTYVLRIWKYRIKALLGL